MGLGGPPMGLGGPPGGPSMGMSGGPGMGDPQAQQGQKVPMKVIKTIDVWNALEKSLSKNKSGQDGRD